MNIQLQNPINPIQYHLFLNTFDNTTVIVTNDLKDLFIRTFVSMGSPAKLLSSSYILSELQIKAIEFGFSPICISDLNPN